MTDEKRKEIEDFSHAKIINIMKKNPIEEWKEKINNQLRMAIKFMADWEKYAEGIAKLKEQG